MTIAETLRQYLKDSGESMRALSLRAGLGEKTVANILRLKGLKPRYETIQALSVATGLDLTACLGEQPLTYQELIDRLNGDARSRAAARVRWLVKSAGWVPQTKIICRRDAVEFLEAQNGARFGLSKGSYATYKSEAIATLSEADVRNRQRNITDVGGVYGEFHQALKDSAMESWRVGLVGSFLVYLHDQEIEPAQITTDVLGAYFAHRLNVSSKSEKKCRDHVKEIADFLMIVSEHPDLSGFGFRAVPHPFEKSTGKYGVHDEVIAALMADFDQNIAPWARGKISRDGMSRDEFIAQLDHDEAQLPDRKKLLRQRRAALAARPGQAKGSDTRSNDELLEASGFLTTKKRWSEKTLATRRGYIVSLAKSIAASVGIVPDTMDELLDPDFLETAADAIKAANKSEFTSGYLGSVLKCARKIAAQYQRRSSEDLERIAALIGTHNREHKGIAPRNRAKLRQFDDARIQATIDLGDTIITGVNAEIDRLRKAHRRKHGVLPKPAEVIDSELARDIMVVIAHEVLLRRAPRSDNLINARLDWFAWQDDLAVMTIPAEEVKMRDADDEDLRIPLDARTSKLLRHYVDTVRVKALLDQDNKNPYLFPRQTSGTLNQPYRNLLGRVTRLLQRHVGIRINPHLYRHLLGWIWLKDSLDHLPRVQRLLGHKSLQTTIEYYAELDESLVFDEWQNYLNNKRKSVSGKAA